MPLRIEDYALIGNCETAALVGRDGSIDWLCVPRFDSPACFAGLLGDASHGRWLVAPAADGVRVSRRYRGDTMILETLFETQDAAVRLTDFLGRRAGATDLVRLVRGVRGTMPMRTALTVRFDNGAVAPWVSRGADGRWQFTAGPDRLLLDASVDLRGEGMETVGEFSVGAEEEVSFSLTWSPSYRASTPLSSPADALASVEQVWVQWATALPSTGVAAEAVRRSLLTLKALAHWETGGIVAAPTTSLPEKLGGTRNWDYRYCWLRDATFTLYALLGVGFVEEARAWREWLVRAAAGTPSDLRIMYGLAGERRLQEYEAPWLPGYEGSAPVRIGNAAAGQVQLDVYGEVIDALYVGRRAGLAPYEASWALERALLDHLEGLWAQPDHGIWEMRGGRRHFTHSKVMAWVAFDRAVRSAVEFGLDGPVERWSELRDVIHAQVCERGFDESLGTFVQSYGSSVLDASLLLIPVVGFLPGRWDEANQLFERLLSLCNDVGLLAEEVDRSGRQLGNFPQALSHLALINAASSLSSAAGTAHQRAGGSSRTGTAPVVAARPPPVAP